MEVIQETVNFQKEVRPDDYFVKTIDLIEIKKEAEDEIELKIKSELLSEECDLPSLKSEDDLIDQPCSESLVSVKLKENDVEEVNKEKEKFPCPVCGKNNSDEWFRCSSCSLEFGKSTAVNVHVSRSDSREFQCLICRKQFSHEKGLTTHLNNHLGISPFTCSLCNKVLRSKSLLGLHLRNHHMLSVRKWPCKPCNLFFYSKISRMRHMYVNHRDEKLRTKTHSFQCMLCGERFMNILLLHNHLDKYNFTAACKLCNVSVINNIYVLRDHLNIHMEEPYVCKICSRWFSHPKTFMSHLLLEHRKDDVVQKCGICLQHYFTHHSLARHMRMKHESEKSESLEMGKGEELKCAECAEYFPSKNLLRIHIRDVHSENAADQMGQKSSENESHKCDSCDKVFETEKKLRAHEKKHEYLEKCKACSEECTSYTKLMRHLDEHITGHKPFQCSLCRRTFDRKKMLKDHLVLEQGRNSQTEVMRCDVCELNYFRKCHFAKHMKNVHDT